MSPKPSDEYPLPNGGYTADRVIFYIEWQVVIGKLLVALNRRSPPHRKYKLVSIRPEPYMFVQLSTGGVVFGLPLGTVHDLLEIADEALYTSEEDTAA